jgi:hypothetical protein
LGLLELVAPIHFLHLEPSNIPIDLEDFMKKILVFATLALIAAACSSAPNVTSVDNAVRGSRTPTPNVDSSRYEIAGMLEVTVSDFKPNSSEGTATAKFYGVDKSGKLSAKGLLVPNSSVAFTPQFVSSFDTFSGPTTTRYVQAGFAITNNSPTTYYNMTMVASSLAAATTSSGLVTTVGGTALSDVVNGLGVPITDVGVARSMLPIHGFTPGATYTPSITKADLHYLTPAEANSVKAQGQASGQIPAVNINKVLPLEYGFVARNGAGTGRIISPSTCVTANCNKGNVTFAYSFPLDADIAKQPRAYKMQFVVANEFIATWSQMLNGETSTVAGVPYSNPLISTHRTRILENGSAGKTFVPVSGVDLLENLCSVKTANAVGADPVLKYPNVSSSPVGEFDACFGEKGVRGKQFNILHDSSTTVSVDPVTDEIVIAAANQGPLGISLVRFDKTGKQTLNAQYTPTDTELGLSTLDGTYPAYQIRVQKVIVSKYQRQIYVFGFAFGGPNLAGITIRSPFMFSFSSTGQILSRVFDFYNTTSNGDFDGDMYLDQQSASPPIVYVVLRDFNIDSGYAVRQAYSYLGGGTSYTFPVNTAFVYSGGSAAFAISPSIEKYGFTLSANSSRLVVAEYDNTNSSIATVATTLTGALDTSWGGAGTTVISKASLGLQPADGFILSSGKLLSDGKLLLAGTVLHNNVPGNTQVVLTKTTAAGAMDMSFAGGAGVATYKCDVIGLGPDSAPRLAVRSNGEIFVVSGTSSSTGNHCVARRDASGVNISRQKYDLYVGQVESPSNDAQLTASGRLVLGGMSYGGLLNSPIVGLIKQ